MRIGLGTIWIAATIAIMIALAFRIAAGGSDFPQSTPIEQVSSLDTEASLLLGDLAADPVLAGRSDDFGPANETILAERDLSDGFKDLGQSAAIVMIAALAIACSVVSAIWLKGRLVY